MSGVCFVMWIDGMPKVSYYTYEKKKAVYTNSVHCTCDNQTTGLILVFRGYRKSVQAEMIAACGSCIAAGHSLTNFFKNPDYTQQCPV